jgi:hypothetical protein
MKQMVLLCAVVALTACTGRQPSSDYQATAHRLDLARGEIVPPLGATVYTLDPSRLRDQPGGENRPLGGSLLQLAGVSLGPDGQLAVRGQ